VHREIDVRVDADEFALVRVSSAVLRISDEKTFHPRDTSSKEPPAWFSSQMSQGILDGNVNRPRDDVIRGRAELALDANCFPFSVTMKNRRAFRVFLQLDRGDFLQRGQILEELLDAQRLTRS
jgi:hypothetical protein